MTVMSVLGPIAADQLGRTLPHEHLLLDLLRVYEPHRDLLLEDIDLAVQEVELLAHAGGATILELTPPDLGRDPHGLAEIARRTGVNIVMGTGRYREPFYEHELREIPTNELAERLISDIEHGVDGIRPGIIGELGTCHGYVSPVEERVHRAAARAHLATGLPLSTHSLVRPVGLQQLDIFEEEGVDPARVVIGHCDTVSTPGYHARLLERGAWVQLDTIRGASSFTTSRQIDLLLSLLDAGHQDRLLLSQDIYAPALLTAHGGNGYGYLFTRFAEDLERRGVTPELFDRLVRDNPRRMLTGEA